MLKYDNTVSSQVDGKPIYGAQVTVYTADTDTPSLATIFADEAGTTPLSQPILTDQLGYFAFYIGDGKYNIRVMTGAVEISRTNITMVDTLQLKQRALIVPVNEDGGTLPPADQRQGKLLGFDSSGNPTMAVPNEFEGPPGPANSTYTTLAGLKAAAVSNASYIFAPPSGSDGGAAAGTFLYQTAGAPYTADGVNVVKLDAVPLTTGALVRQGTQQVSHTPKGESAAIATKGFLDRFGYWAEDESGIQQANNLIVASGDRNIINLPPERVITQSTGLIIDASLASFNGRGSVLDSSTMTSGAAVRVTGSVPLPWRQSGQTFALPILRGPLTTLDGVNIPGTTALDGLVLDRTGSDTHGEGPAHLNFQGINISGFNNGVVLRDRAYLNTFYDSNIFGCNYCVWQDDAVDGQEKNVFVSGTMFNSNWAAKLSTTKCDLQMISVSFDANDRLFDIQQGRLYLQNAHVEAVGRTYSATPILLGSEFSRLFWDGGCRVTPLEYSGTFDYWVSLASGSIMLDNCSEELGGRTSSGAFATGAGTIIRGHQGSNEIRDGAYILHATKSRVPDPAFTSLATSSSMLVPFGPPYAEPDRWTETLSGATTTALTVDSGRLKHNQISGAPASFRLIYPANPNELFGGRILYSKEDGSSGTMFLSASWAYIDPISGGIVKTMDYGTITVSLSSATVPPTQANFQPAGSQRAPSWANAWVLSVSRQSMGVSAMFFSNPNFDKVA